MFGHEKSLTGAPSSATAPRRVGLVLWLEDQRPQRSRSNRIDPLGEVDPNDEFGRWAVRRLRFFRAHGRLPRWE
jgi:hypothetical protein